jgi:CRISPR-associated protein Cas2
MIYLIFYDISTDKIRNKIAKRLLAEGFERLQLSVFVGIVNPYLYANLWQQLNYWASADDLGKLYVISCTKKQFRQMKIIGDNPLDLNYLIGEKSVIFI